jgi:hypothetical protein
MDLPKGDTSWAFPWHSNRTEFESSKTRIPDSPYRPRNVSSSRNYPWPVEVYNVWKVTRVTCNQPTQTRMHRVHIKGPKQIRLTSSQNFPQNEYLCMASSAVIDGLFVGLFVGFRVIPLPPEPPLEPPPVSGSHQRSSLSTPSPPASSTAAEASSTPAAPPPSAAAPAGASFSFSSICFNVRAFNVAA